MEEEEEGEGQRAHSVRVLFLTVVVIRCQQLQVRIWVMENACIHPTVDTHLYYSDHRPGGRVSTYSLQGDHISACWKTYTYIALVTHILVHSCPCSATHSLCRVVWFFKIAGSSSVVCSPLKWPNTNLVLWVTLQQSIHVLKTTCKIYWTRVYRQGVVLQVCHNVFNEHCCGLGILALWSNRWLGNIESSCLVPRLCGDEAKITVDL